LADVLSCGDTDHTRPLAEDAITPLERRAFMGLLRHETTLARMEHTLATGKPLRN